jgi:hypothetical protein
MRLFSRCRLPLGVPLDEERPASNVTLGLYCRTLRRPRRYPLSTSAWVSSGSVHSCRHYGRIRVASGLPSGESARPAARLSLAGRGSRPQRGPQLDRKLWSRAERFGLWLRCVYRDFDRDA